MLKRLALLVLIFVGGCDSFVLKGDLRRGITRLKSSSEDIEALVAAAMGKIKKAEAEVTASRQSRKQGLTKRQPFSASSNEEAKANKPSRKVNDDSIGFLIDMQQKLDNPDYKRIFESPAVRGILDKS